jgi:hypothetical protein
MIAARKASIVQSSETKVNSCRQTLSVRLTPLLISAGLVKGCTHTFGQRLLNLGIRDIVLFAPDGSVVDTQKGD